MKINQPRIYISYMEDGNHVMRGPFHTVSPDGFDITGQKWQAYQVQTEALEFLRITVPWYHSILSAI